MPLCGTIGQIVRTQKKKSHEELTIEWKIDKFSLFFFRETGDWYESPLFSFSDSCWHLSLYPNGHKHPPSSGSMMLYIEKKDIGPPKNIHVKFAIGGSGGVELKVETQWEFSNAENPWFGCKICKRSELTKFRYKLIPDDMLNITCDLKTDVPREPSFFQDASVQTEAESDFLSTNDSQLSDKKDVFIQTDEVVESEVQSSKQEEMKSPKRKIPQSEKARVVNKKMKDDMKKSSIESKFPEIKEARVVIEKMQILELSSDSGTNTTNKKKKSSTENIFSEIKEARVVIKKMQDKKSSMKRKFPGMEEACAVIKKMLDKKSSREIKILESKETNVISKMMKVKKRLSAEKKIPESEEASAISKKMQSKKKSSSKRNITQSKGSSSHQQKDERYKRIHKEKNYRK